MQQQFTQQKCVTLQKITDNKMKYEEIRCGKEVLKVPRAESYGDCIKLMRSDFYRYTGQKASFIKMLFSRHKTFRLNFWLRLSSYRGWAYYFTKYMLNRIRQHTNIDIIETTRIGFGFLLNHNMCIVINPTPVIGNNCNFSQFTTIGANCGNAAVIGNNVYIGPNVCTVENVSIGSNSTIGAGAVVIKDIPQNVTAAGVPAKVISNNMHSDFIQHPWNDICA